MVFPNKNGFGRTYFRECYCYLVCIHGYPCCCFGDENDAQEIADVIRSKFLDSFVEVDVDVKQVKFFSHW